LEEEIVKILKTWDGKHNDVLQSLHHQYADDEWFMPVLVRISQLQPELQVQTTWIIKKHIEDGEVISKTERKELLKACLGSGEWASKLHIFQILSHWNELTEEEAFLIEDSARKGIKDDNKFLRAWSYQALFEVSKVLPDLRRELVFLCERAIPEESASVKVRLREILKEI
jgi:hypothetical protein